MSVDGHDVRAVNLASLRREIGVIAQDPFLFSATVRENIAFGRPGRDGGRRRAGGPAGAGARVRRGAAGRIRHGRRRARDHALGRTAAAPRDRARARRRSADPDSRRRHGVRRRNDGGADPRRPARGDARPHDDHHRPPSLDDRPRRRDRRPRGRPRRRARESRPSSSSRAPSTARSTSTGCSSASSARKSREGPPAGQPPDARRQADGRRLVVAADEAPPARALPARAAVSRAHAARDRVAARRDGGLTRRRRTWSAGPSTRCAAATRTCSSGSSPRSSPPGVLGVALQLRPDLLHRLDRRADAGRPAQRPLPPPAAALARLLRAEPRRRDHQPPDERRRGTRPARHRRRQLARPEHADAGRHRGAALLPRLAAGARRRCV